MMTPQEVASHAFAKATLGGYNMAMVDEFLLRTIPPCIMTTPF